MKTCENARGVMSQPVVAVTPEATIDQVAAVLADHRIGAVPVVDDYGRALGIVTEPDLTRSATADKPTATAADVMSAPVVTVQAADRVEDVLRAMRKHGVGRVPVVDAAGRVIGIISGSDLRRNRTPGFLGDADVRRHVIDRVIDAGGEVLDVSVRDGVVHLRVQAGGHGDIPLIERMLRDVPGVERLELTVGCVGDARDRPAGHFRRRVGTGSATHR